MLKPKRNNHLRDQFEGKTSILVNKGIGIKEKKEKIKEKRKKKNSLTKG